MPKPSKPILAVHARVGAGKTSLIDYFKRDGYRLAKASFAEALKNEVAHVFGIERSFLDENKNIFRPLLIAWGHTKRHFNPDVWVDRLMSDLAHEWEVGDDDAYDFIYCDDMRYMNEFNAFYKADATLIHLECPIGDSIGYMVSKGMSALDATEASRSPSETQLDHCEGFHINIDAPRVRPLESIYQELLAALIHRGVLEAK